MTCAYQEDAGDNLVVHDVDSGMVQKDSENPKRCFRGRDTGESEGKQLEFGVAS